MKNYLVPTVIEETSKGERAFDIYSRLQIEELLTEFKLTMIFVEHDKAFREKIATNCVYG